MSKVHEALKRAQEERKRTSGENANDGHIGIVGPKPSGSGGETTIAAGPAPLSDHYFGTPQEAVDAEIPPVSAPSTDTRTEPPTNIPAFVAPAVPHSTSSHPVIAATPGRDLRTGQFLRFEDLLNNCVKPAWVLDPRTVVFSQAHEQRKGAEQFRTLRTRLYQLRETSPLKKILVTSALAAEGKTFVATNLAQAIAQERERRVLLIDADMRNPNLHLPLGAPLGPGLTQFLQGEASDSDVIQHGHEGKLCFIAAGKPTSNASELLSNGKLEKLLERLTPLFDWVIIDSPPCLPVADANALAGFCDGVLLVVRAKATPSAALGRARKELEKRKVLGVVINAVEESDSYGEYYSYTQRDSARQM
jgi:protein-tyrosine kinase